MGPWRKLAGPLHGDAARSRWAGGGPPGGVGPRGDAALGSGCAAACGPASSSRSRSLARGLGGVDSPPPPSSGCCSAGAEGPALPRPAARLGRGLLLGWGGGPRAAEAAPLPWLGRGRALLSTRLGPLSGWPSPGGRDLDDDAGGARNGCGGGGPPGGLGPRCDAARTRCGGGCPIGGTLARRRIRAAAQRNCLSQDRNNNNTPRGPLSECPWSCREALGRIPEGSIRTQRSLCGRLGALLGFP